MNDKIKILYLAANPKRTKRLQLDEEIRAVTQKIESAKYRDMIELVPALAVRPDDLLDLLNKHKPHVVHFSGHGIRTGEILLVDNARNKPKPVTADAIKDLFRTFEDNLRLVVLNECYSRIQADAIVENIDCVVGMNTSISDQAAIVFAAGLYGGLAWGRSVKDAFEQGKASLSLNGILDEKNTPVLLSRVGVNAANVYILNPESGTGGPATGSPGAITPPAPHEVEKSISDRQLIDFVNEHFNTTEISSLCTDLAEALRQAKKISINEDIDIETFSSKHEPREAIAQAMVQHFRKRGWTSFLVAAVKAERQDVFQDTFGG